MSSNDQIITDMSVPNDTQQITTFTDDVEASSYEKPMITTTTMWVKMAEDEKLHDVHAILSRPTIVSESSFDTTTPLPVLTFPEAILNNSQNIVDKLNRFTFFRANVKVKLVFNATPFQQGRYWLFFSPFDTECNRPQTGQLSNQTGYPGVEIDLASGAPVEVKIPYCAPLSHYDLVNGYSTMGELRLVELNQIQDGTVPASPAYFTIYAWFEDIELALPNPVKILQAQVGEEQQATSGPSISGVASTIASMASAAGKVIPQLNSVLHPVEWAARATSKVASTLGFNKPTNLDKNCLFTNVPGKGFTNCDGIDMSSKLAAMPDNSVTQEEGLFSTDLDEMDMSYVCSKSCVMQTGIDWNITQAAGTQVYFWPNMPGICSSGYTGLRLPVTILGYVASMFSLWRGSIKYRITIAKTGFHSGRLRLTYYPGDSIFRTTNKDPQSAYNWILDLSVSSEFEIEVPYISNVPWKRVMIGAQDETVWNDIKYHTGCLQLTVLNQLRRSSDSVADNCPVNVWISGGSDISFSIPDFGGYVTQTNPQVLEAQVFNLTSNATNHDEQVRDHSISMFPKSLMDDVAAEKLTIGEKVQNLRQLIKRFTVISTGASYPYYSFVSGRYCFPGPMPLNNDDYLYNKLTIDPAYFGVTDGTDVPNEQLVTLPVIRNTDGSFSDGPDFVAARTYPAQNPLHYISYLYRFWRGSKRYKMICPPSESVEYNSQGFGEATQAGLFVNRLVGMTISESQRPARPLIIKREFVTRENGPLSAPIIGTFTGADVQPTFEHVVFPDINGIAEFEVPYYSQVPISLVGEGTIQNGKGTLVTRSFIKVSRSTDPRGLDQPAYTAFDNAGYLNSSAIDAGMRPCFGAYSLLEAAGDDFSFGYLVGAPYIRRIF